MSTLSSKGISSLFALVIMVGVLGASLTVTRILLYQQTNARRESKTSKEMKEIYQAIMGNPELGTFGYVGDMGTPPASLDDFTVSPGASSFIGINGVKMGWNGPYINAGRDSESYKKDAWGNDYIIVDTRQIRSNGPDGMADTYDDIVFPAKPPDINGSLVVKVPKGGVLCDVSDIKETVVYYSEEGMEKSKSLGMEDFNLSDNMDGFYITEPIPLHHGIHAVQVKDNIDKTALANIAVFAGSTNTQIVGTLPHEGITLHPLFLPHISGNDDRVVEIDIVNATGCYEGEGVSYDVSRIDIVEIRGVEEHRLLEISFNNSVVFAHSTGIPISHDIENPTSIALSETYHLQPGKSLNKLKFLNHMGLSAFILTYSYTDEIELTVPKVSNVRFQLE